MDVPGSGVATAVDRHRLVVRTNQETCGPASRLPVGPGPPAERQAAGRKGGGEQSSRDIGSAALARCLRLGALKEQSCGGTSDPVRTGAARPCARRTDSSDAGRTLGHRLRHRLPRRTSARAPGVWPGPDVPTPCDRWAGGRATAGPGGLLSSGRRPGRPDPASTPGRRRRAGGRSPGGRRPGRPTP